MAGTMNDSAGYLPFELIPGTGDIILVCDHARNDVPPDLGDLGVPPADMQRHIAFDVGARAVTLCKDVRDGGACVWNVIVGKQGVRFV